MTSPEVDVRIDEQTGEYILGKQDFNLLWAYMEYLEGRIKDLKGDAIGLRETNANNVKIAELSIQQINDLIMYSSSVEKLNLDLMIKNAEPGYSTFEVALVTTLGVLAGAGAAFIAVEFTN